MRVEAEGRALIVPPGTLCLPGPDLFCHISRPNDDAVRAIRRAASRRPSVAFYPAFAGRPCIPAVAIRAAQNNGGQK